MAKCSICEKASHFGIKVSHSHRRANREWKSNVKKVRVNSNGTVV
jgi:large subunit ribosomal protein L28